MRILTILVAALAALITVPATAQSAGSILGTINGTRYNNCAYSSGVYKATCQIERVTRMADNFRSSQKQNQYQQSSNLDRKISMIRALERACKAGDQHSCTRIGGSMNTQRADAARAIMDACRMGDRFSCERVDNVLMGRDTSYYGKDRRVAQRQAPAPVQFAGSLKPNQARIGNCIVTIDPATGMRTSDTAVCR